MWRPFFANTSHRKGEVIKNKEAARKAARLPWPTDTQGRRGDIVDLCSIFGHRTGEREKGDLSRITEGAVNKLAHSLPLNPETVDAKLSGAGVIGRLGLRLSLFCAHKVRGLRGGCVSRACVSCGKRTRNQGFKPEEYDLGTRYLKATGGGEKPLLWERTGRRPRLKTKSRATHRKDITGRTSWSSP